MDIPDAERNQRNVPQIKFTRSAAFNSQASDPTRKPESIPISSKYLNKDPYKYQDTHNFSSNYSTGGANLIFSHKKMIEDRKMLEGFDHNSIAHTNNTNALYLNQRQMHSRENYRYDKNRSKSNSPPSYMNANNPQRTTRIKTSSHYQLIMNNNNNRKVSPPSNGIR